MNTTFNPDYQGATVRPSPNFDVRKNDTKLQFLILHYTGMDTAEAALQRLADTEAKVSSHYVVCEDGTIVQMVREQDRAWHAGAGTWCGLDDINSRSVGIEIVNQGGIGNYPDFPEEQIKGVIALCKEIIARHAIELRYILGHSDIAPQRKEDPGEKFSWGALYHEGIGLWVEPTPIRDGRFMNKGESGQPVEAFQAMLSLYGYDVPMNGVFDEETENVTRAFQRHFRPEKVDGVADFSTVDTLRNLLGQLKKLG